MASRRAVIYVHRTNAAIAGRRCLAHCINHDYDVVSVVIEADGTQRWRDAFAVVAAGLADVIVASGLNGAIGGLPVEIAGEDGENGPGATRQNGRRPRRTP